MVLIERLVPPENLFTEIEEAREKIRLEKNKEDEAKKGKLGHDNQEPESKSTKNDSKQILIFVVILYIQKIKKSIKIR